MFVRMYIFSGTLEEIKINDSREKCLEMLCLISYYWTEISEI